LRFVLVLPGRVRNGAQAIKKVHSPIDEYTHDEI